MTDKQMEMIFSLIADKLEACKTMDDLKKAIRDFRKLAGQTYTSDQQKSNNEEK